MRIILASFVLAAALLGAGLAFGAPPPDADPSLAPWFRDLQQPGGASCCDVSDCRPVDSRTVGDHYEALLEDGRWLAIPTDRVIHPKTNPIGRAVLCKSPWSDAVYCFSPPIEV